MTNTIRTSFLVLTMVFFIVIAFPAFADSNSPADDTAPISIIVQPQNQTGVVGDVVTFDIVAIGSNLTYSWYMSVPSHPDDWYDLETSEPSWTIPVEEKYDGLRFYCVVTDENGNTATSDTVSLEVIDDGSGIIIVKQPENTLVQAGNVALFEIDAHGDDLTYVWYVYSPDDPNAVVEISSEKYWALNAEEEFNDARIYCVITDGNGNSRNSNTVVLNVVRYDPEDPKKTEGWNENEKGWWYQNPDGSYSVSKWQCINRKWYHFDSNGYMQTGWLKQGCSWYYLSQNGTMVTGWKKIDEKWYFFSSDGIMQTGWQKIDSIWYYFDASGTMATEWRKIDNTWYYFDPQGHMVSGWRKISDQWYYFSQGGNMTTGWRKIDDTWYYFKTGGAMQNGWLKIKSEWYYFDQNGAMATGWRQISGKWYFFSANGVMASKQWVGDYYLMESGVMATNQWIGNYYVDKTGKWVPEIA